MKQETTTRAVSIADLWLVLRRAFLWMLAAAVLCCCGVYAVNRLTFSPEYESTATLYILKQENGKDYQYTSSDFSLALNVVNDCTYMLKSHAVLDQVIADLDLSIRYSDLAKRISTVNPDSTRILEVTVRTGDAQLSKQVVDKVCQVGAENISRAMGFEQVNIYEYGTVNARPCNTLSMRVYLLAGAAAMLLVYAAALLRFLLDDKLRTAEDVTRDLHISVLGELPYIGKGQRGRRGAYKAAGYRPYGREPKQEGGEDHG